MSDGTHASGVLPNLKARQRRAYPLRGLTFAYHAKTRDSPAIAPKLTPKPNRIVGMRIASDEVQLVQVQATN